MLKYTCVKGYGMAQKANVRVSDTTKASLDRLKMVQRETYDEVITRLIKHEDEREEAE